MDTSHHGHQDPYANKESAQWTAVNRLSYSAIGNMDSPSRGPVAVQTTIPGVPVIKPGGHIQLKGPMSIAPRVIMPRPSPVYRPTTNARPCLVCGRPSCVLVSHKHFAEQALTRRRSRQPATPTKIRTSRQSQSLSQSSIPDQALHYPIMMDAESHELLALWSQNWSRTRRGPERHLFPSRWIDMVLPIAINHGPLMQALLATSAAMWAMAHNTLSEVTTRHLRLADQMLDQARTDVDAAKADESLLAALMLTFVHQAQGNDHETHRRFANVVKHVEQRGGPYYLGLSGIVADVLLYVDYLQAALLNCEPVNHLPLPPLQIGIPRRLGAEFRGLTPSNLLSADLLTAADSVCRTTDIYEQLGQFRILGAGSSNSFGYLSTISEYQLAHCNAVFHGSSTWDECICLALLLFNHIVLRHHGAIAAPVRKLEHQFWRTVEDTINRGGTRDMPPCLILWLFMTGLSSSILVDCQYRALAIKRMRAAKISATITGWEHYQRKVLDDFVWLRAAQEDTFHDIWLELENHQPFP